MGVLNGMSGKNVSLSNVSHRNVNRSKKGRTGVWQALMVSGLLTVTACAATQMQESGLAILPAELEARIERDAAPLILDVRSPKEFEQGHVPGAINIPHDQLAQRLEELNIQKTDEVVVYCRSGRRAANASAVLKANQFTNVRDLTGHWIEWSSR